MSGGSYNYICYKDEEEMFKNSTLDDIESMASRLIELGYEDAAKETLQLKYTIQQAMIRSLVMKGRLNEVWKAVEWFDSADTSMESVEKAIHKYRGG